MTINRRNFLRTTMDCAVAVPALTLADGTRLYAGKSMSIYLRQDEMRVPAGSQLWITHIDYETKTVTFDTVRPR